MDFPVEVLLTAEEWERFHRRAAAEGLSVGDWLIVAGRARLAETRKRGRFDSPAALAAFFGSCDEREEGTEPDWEDHLRVINAARRSGEV